MLGFISGPRALLGPQALLGPLALSLVLGLAWTTGATLSLASAPAVAQKQKGKSKSKQKGKQPARKAKKVKALSLAAQNHVIKIGRIIQKFSDISDEGDAVRKAAQQSEKQIVLWRKELKDPELELSDKQKAKIRGAIADAEKIIAAAPKRIEQAEAAALAQIGKAVPVLDAMQRAKAKLQSQDLAAMWNYYGYVYAILERFEDARNAYENLLNEDEVAESLRLQALFSSGQLSMLLEEFERGVKRLEEWFNFSVELGRPVRPGDHFLLAQGYYSLKRYKDVVGRINLTLERAAETGVPVKERWLRLLAATYFAQEDFGKARDPLELLVLLFPKREYWLQLQGTYGELEMRENQLAILDLAWRQGLLEKETEYISLSQHLQVAKDPYEAAVVLAEGMDKRLQDEDGEDEGPIVEADYDNLKMLGNYWYQAKETEKALAVFRAAAELGETGEMQYRIATLLNLENRIPESLTAAKAAYTKGNFASRTEARILYGQCLLETGELEAALEIFRELQKAGFEDQVKTWIKYANAQLQARNAISDTIELYRKQEKAILDNLRGN